MGQLPKKRARRAFVLGVSITALGALFLWWGTPREDSLPPPSSEDPLVLHEGKPDPREPRREFPLRPVSLSAKSKARSFLGGMTLMSGKGLDRLLHSLDELDEADKVAVIEAAYGSPGPAHRELAFWLGARRNSEALLPLWEDALFGDRGKTSGLVRHPLADQAEHRTLVERRLALKALGALAVESPRARSMIFALAAGKRTPTGQSLILRRAAARLLMAARPGALLRLSRALPDEDPLRGDLQAMLAGGETR